MDEAVINKKFKEQNKILQQLLEENAKTRRTLNWIRIMSVIKIVLIAAPIILGVIYLPPFVKKIINDYKNIVPGLERVYKIIEQEKPSPQR